MKPHVSVVIPAYNEEENLRPTIESVRAKLDELETTFEIIIVNDGSSDRT
jgi:dolichol-phosphate mannosyltransferase